MTPGVVPAEDQALGPPEYESVNRRTAMITGLALLLATAAGLAAQILTRLIGESRIPGRVLVLLDDSRRLVGVVTRRDLLDSRHPGSRCIGEIIARGPVVIYDDSSLPDAADHMVLEQVGRLPVVRRDAMRELVGIISRSDLLAAHRPRLEAANRARRIRRLPLWISGQGG